jgi:hypothetical protein
MGQKHGLRSVSDSENLLQIDLAPSTQLMEISLSTRKNNSSEVTTKVKYLYVVRMSCAISTYPQSSGLFKIMFEAASKFVIENRSPKEIFLFDEMNSSRELPRDCFINLYAARITSGLKPHRDQSSFCSVIFFCQVILMEN